MNRRYEECPNPNADVRFASDCELPSIIITGMVADETARALAFKNERELSDYFHPDIIKAAKSFKVTDINRQREIIKAAAGAVVIELGGRDREKTLTDRLSAFSRSDFTSGGLFDALWELAKRTRMGMDIDLTAVPIRQETIEICEYFSLNPYGCYSAGSLLIATGKEKLISAALDNSFIINAVIGSLSLNNDKILRHNGLISYLNRPAE